MCKREAEEDVEMGYFQQDEKYRNHTAFYTLVMVLGVFKAFFQTKGSCKDGFWRAF